jgi:hypothetical protein
MTLINLLTKKGAVMKRRLTFCYPLVIAMLFLVNELDAKKPKMEEYFLGKWKTIIYGLPQGDVEMVITFEKEDGKIGGHIYTSENPSEKIAFADVEVEDNSITAYYVAQGYDVFIVLEKKDSEKAVGRMMDLYDMEATKIKE